MTSEENNENIMDRKGNKQGNVEKDQEKQSLLVLFNTVATKFF